MEFENPISSGGADCLTSTSKSFDVDIVIVAFNSQHVIGELLATLPKGGNIIVVDNASIDRMDKTVNEGSVRCVRSESNLGFGKASNLGASLGSGKFILFVNPDTVFPPNAFEMMLETLERFPDAAIVGPRLVQSNGNSLWRYKSIIHPMGESPLSPPTEPVGTCCVPLLTGAALFCRREAFEGVGGFDENIFLYHEDDDLCRRLTQRGWSLIYEPSAVVTHASGRSSGNSMKLARFKAMHKLTSAAYVSRKYGIPFDISKQWRKSCKRLLISILTLRRERFSAALGRLEAIENLNAETDSISRRGNRAEGAHDFETYPPPSKRKFF